ncbi:MAG: hypothetical protein ACP5NQ_01480 [Vulcanisaeta sp.]
MLELVRDGESVIIEVSDEALIGLAIAWLVERQCRSWECVPDLVGFLNTAADAMGKSIALVRDLPRVWDAWFRVDIANHWVEVFRIGRIGGAEIEREIFNGSLLDYLMLGID